MKKTRIRNGSPYQADQPNILKDAALMEQEGRYTEMLLMRSILSVKTIKQKQRDDTEAALGRLEHLYESVWMEMTSTFGWEASLGARNELEGRLNKENHRSLAYPEQMSLFSETKRPDTVG